MARKGAKRAQREDVTAPAPERWARQEVERLSTAIADEEGRPARPYRATDTLLVTCRSGGRSALAVNALAKAGFKRAYNVIDGMEGDLVNDPGSANHGKRMKNGWKNSGAPWTYDVNPALLWISARRAGEQSHGEPN